MTDTPKPDNKAPANFDHDTKRAIYIAQRASHRDEYAGKPIDVAEGKTPSFNGN